MMLHTRILDGDSLGYFNKLIADVQTRLNDDRTGVQLYNLTACYAASGGSPSCWCRHSPTHPID